MKPVTRDDIQVQEVLESHLLKALAGLDLRKIMEEAAQKTVDLISKPNLSVKETARYLGCSCSFVRQELRKHIPVRFLQPPNSRLGRAKYVFERRALDLWLEKNQGANLDVKRHLDGFLNGLVKKKAGIDGFLKNLKKE